MNTTTSALFTALALLALPAFASSHPDNSKINKAMENNDELNAQDQGNSKGDLDMTRQIRRSVMRAKDLSTDAKNVKIISSHGNVTLKGPVKSEYERTAIEKIADSVAGAQNVTNEIEVE